MKKLKLLLLLIIFCLFRWNISFADIVVTNQTDKYIKAKCFTTTQSKIISLIRPNDYYQIINGEIESIKFKIYDRNPEIDNTPITTIKITDNVNKSLFIIQINDEGITIVKSLFKTN